MNNNLRFTFKEIVIIIMLVIVLPISVFIGKRKTVNYMVNGENVTATITDVRQNGITIKSGETVTVVYENDKGEMIYAKAITNSNDNHVGKVIVGKIIKDDPYNVYVMPSKGLNIFLYILTGLLFLMGILFLWGKGRCIRIDKLLRNHGTTVVDAKVTKVYHNGSNHYVDLEFVDNQSNVLKAHTEDYISSRQVGDTCIIRYYIKSPNNIYSKILKTM